MADIFSFFNLFVFHDIFSWLFPLKKLVFILALQKGPSLIPVWHPQQNGCVRNYLSGARFTKFKSLLSYSLTGTFPIINSASRENCDSKVSDMNTLVDSL